MDDTVNIISWTPETLQVSVNKQKIQEKLTSGLTGTLTNAASILSDKKIRGVKGVDIGVSVENDLVCLTGPPIGQWSGQTGLDNNVHYIDTGPNELRIRDTSEPRANILEIYPSKSCTPLVLCDDGRKIGCK